MSLACLVTCLSADLFAQEPGAPTADAPATSTPPPPAPSATPPPSQADKELGRLHYLRGEALYKEGKLKEALVEMKEAYRLAQLPDLLFNLGRLSEKTGYYKEAIEYLDRYLQEKPEAADRAQVEADLVRLRKLTAPPPRIEVEPAPAPLVQPPKMDELSRRPSWLPPWGAVGLLGGGVVFLILGAGLGGGAMAQASTVQGAADPMAPPVFSMGLYDAEQRGRSLSGAAITFDVLGGVALAGGAAWSGYYFYTKHKAKKVAAR